MRLTDYQAQAIRQLARQVGGDQSRVRVFGSRLASATTVIECIKQAEQLYQVVYSWIADNRPDLA